MSSRAQLQETLLKTAEQVVRPVFEYAQAALAREIELLEAGSEVNNRAKIVADPLWTPIRLSHAEAFLIDSSVVQRLRHVQQLGLASLAYPTATHDRLQHSFGVVAAVQRVLDSLAQVAAYPSSEAETPGANPAPVSEPDRLTLRYSALLHDIGHLPFSHALEPLMAEWFESDLNAIRAHLREALGEIHQPKPAELLTALLLLSPAMSTVLTHQHFPGTGLTNLPERLAATILASPKFLDSPYLAGLISGPIDCDKLDYMARDSTMSGFPIGLDRIRQISTLKPILITDKNCPTKEAKEKVDTDGQFFVLGLSEAGITAYEQMVISRVLLYDRIYNHHKVRCAEEMLRSATRSAFPDGHGFLEYSFSSATDQVFLAGLEGTAKVRSFLPKTDSSLQECSLPEMTACKGYPYSISKRQLLKRALVISQRTIKVSPELSPEAQEQERIERSRQTIDYLRVTNTSAEFRARLLGRIFDICDHMREFEPLRQHVSDHAVLVTVSKDEGSSSSRHVYVQNRLNEIVSIEHYFRSATWIEAYNTNKQAAYIFCDPRLLQLVSLAASIVLAESRFVFFRPTSLLREPLERSLKLLCEQGIVRAEVAEALLDAAPARRPGYREDLKVSDDVVRSYPGIRESIVKEINAVERSGFTTEEWSLIGKGVHVLTQLFAAVKKHPLTQFEGQRPEDACQYRTQNMLDVLADYEEHPGMAGGISDIVIDKDFVLELKYADKRPNVDAFDAGVRQASVYANAKLRRFASVAVFYEARSNDVVLPVEQSFKVTKNHSDPSGTACLMVFIPIQRFTPSRPAGKS